MKTVFPPAAGTPFFIFRHGGDPVVAPGVLLQIQYGSDRKKGAETAIAKNRNGVIDWARLRALAINGGEVEVVATFVNGIPVRTKSSRSAPASTRPDPTTAPVRSAPSPRAAGPAIVLECRARRA